jgi:predicted nucleic acid-binding protein
LSALLDTSVLVPAFLEDHEHHERSLRVFLGAKRERDCCAAHSLAEVYATMTRLPGRHRLSEEQVLLFLENIRERLAVISLTGEEYHTAIKDAAATGVTGGTIYDALIARCALKARVNAIYTWNVRHFERLGPAISKRLRTP